MKNILNKIRGGITKAWQWSVGKKRWLSMGCGLLSQLLPEHTLIARVAGWTGGNLDYITIGLEVAAGLFGATAVVEHSAGALKEGYEADTLPKGITKIMDIIPDSLTGIKGVSNGSARSN
jgi:hypothetical protein